WRGEAGNWIPTAAIAVLVGLAHPMGLVWATAVVAYLLLRPLLRGASKLVVPLAVVAALRGMRSYVGRSSTILADFYNPTPFHATGADQVVLYGTRYEYLAWAALIIGLACFVLDGLVPRKQPGHWNRLDLP